MKYAAASSPVHWNRFCRSRSQLEIDAHLGAELAAAGRVLRRLDEPAQVQHGVQARSRARPPPAAPRRRCRASRARSAPSARSGCRSPAPSSPPRRNRPRGRFHRRPERVRHRVIERERAGVGALDRVGAVEVQLDVVVDAEVELEVRDDEPPRARAADRAELAGRPPRRPVSSHSRSVGSNRGPRPRDTRARAARSSRPSTRRRRLRGSTCVRRRATASSSALSFAWRAWPACAPVCASSWRAGAPPPAPAAAFARPVVRGRRPRCCCLRDRSRTPRSSAGGIRFARPARPLSVPPAASAAAWNASTRCAIGTEGDVQRMERLVGRRDPQIELARLAQAGAARELHRDRVADRERAPPCRKPSARGKVLNAQADVVEHARQDTVIHRDLWLRKLQPLADVELAPGE